MNPSDWNPLFVTLLGLGLSAVMIVALAELVSRRTGRAQTQRAVWIAAATLLLGLTVAEWFGARVLVEPIWTQAPKAEAAASAPSLAPANLPPTPLSAQRIAVPTVTLTAQPLLEATTSGERVAGWLALVWMGGVALLLARCGLALGLLPLVRRRLQPVRDTELLALAKEVRERLGLKRTPELRQGSVASPMTFGLFRPVVCLPEPFVAEFPPQQQRAVLAHEFAHVASLDALWRCVGEVLAALLWWHPAVWLVRRRLHSACEFAADEASRLTGPVEGSLAEALVALAAKPGRVAPWPVLAAAGDGYHSDLGQRVERLLDSPDTPPALPKAGWRWSAGALLAAAVLMTGLSACRTGGESPAKQAGNILRQDESTETATANSRDTNLITRSFKVDPYKFAVSFQQATGVSWNELVAAVPTGTASLRARERAAALQKYFAHFGLPLGLVVGFQITNAMGKMNLDGLAEQAINYDSGGGLFLARLNAREMLGLSEILRNNGLLLADPAPAGQADTGLITRTFKVDPNTFVQGLENVMEVPVFKGAVIDTNAFRKELENGVDTRGLIRRYLTAVGVDLTPPKAMFFNDRTGLLMVRAAAADLELLQTAIDVLNISPPQITIEAKWIEITDEGMKALAKEWPVFSPHPVGGKPFEPGPVLPDWSGLKRTNENFRIESETTHSASVLTAPQGWRLLKELEQQKEVSIVASPKVTTLSGMQAQIAVQDMKTVVAGVSVTDGSDRAINYQTTNVPFGPVLDVLPEVRSDGFSIWLMVKANSSKFLGYDDPGAFVPQGTAGAAEPNTGVLPLPRIRSLTIEASAVVWDGQSLLLGGLKAEDEQEVEAADGTKTQQKVTKHLFVLITPTIIDPAGNRVHSEEDIAKQQGTARP